MNDSGADSSVSNAELAAVFRECAHVMLYQGASWFKVRAYLGAAELLDGAAEPVVNLSDVELKALSGVGKAVFSKIREYQQTRTFNLLARVRQVPEPTRRMLAAGLPPAAVRALEGELEIRSLEALQSAHDASALALERLPKRHRAAVRAFLG